jgi:hypothetical protein
MKRKRKYPYVSRQQQIKVYGKAVFFLQMISYIGYGCWQVIELLLK